MESNLEKKYTPEEQNHFKHLYELQEKGNILEMNLLMQQLNDHQRRSFEQFIADHDDLQNWVRGRIPTLLKAKQLHEESVALQEAQNCLPDSRARFFEVEGVNISTTTSDTTSVRCQKNK